MASQPGYAGKMWAAVKSVRLALFLISCITAAVTVDVIFLARRWVPSEAGFNTQTGEVYRYWWFKLLVILFLINLTACTVNGLIKRYKAPGGGFGRWGSSLFHAGLILVVTGAFMTGGYRVLATITLIEGETKTIPYQALTHQETSGFDETDKFSITMSKQNMKTDGMGQVKDTVSDIELKDRWRTDRHMAGDHQQFFYRSVYMFPQKFGYAVKLDITDPKGGKIKGPSLVLATEEFAGMGKVYSRESASVPSFPYQLTLTLHPDVQDVGGQTAERYLNRTGLLGQPRLSLQVRGNNVLLLEKVLNPGNTVEVEGYRITFGGVKPWTELGAVYDPGANIAFWGTVLSLTGLTVLALFGKPRRHGPAQAGIKSEVREGAIL